MKTLICVIGQLRAADATWESFKRHVVDELQADVAVAAEGDEYNDGNPFWRHACVRLTTPRPGDLAAEFDRVQRLIMQPPQPCPDWRCVLAIPGNWIGGMEPSSKRPGAGAILIYKKWAFLQQLAAAGAMNAYDRFVITRSDFLWLAPHPPVALLDPASLWIPGGEDYGGTNDRHAVVSASDLAAYLDGLTPIVSTPAKVVRAGIRQDSWNIEGYVRWQLRHARVLNRVRRFAYVMALVRSASDPPGWSPGEWDDKRAVYAKAPREMLAAEANAAVFRAAADWERHIGHAPSTDHVLRRACLVPVRRFRRPRLAASPGDWRSTVIPVGLGTDGIFPLTSGRSPKSKFLQNGRTWLFTPPTRLEKKLLGLRDASYVACGNHVLHVARDGRVQFRRLPPQPKPGVLGRLRIALARINRGSLFRLHAPDDAAGQEALSDHSQLTHRR